MTSDAGTNANAELKDKVNEISLLLVMSSAQDQIGVDMICDSWDGLCAGAGSTPPAAKIIAGWNWVKAKKAALKAEEFFSMLTDLVNCSLQYCEGAGNVSFPHEKSSGQDAGNMLAGVDLTFLPEFIETHRMQLDDFESWLLDFEFKNEHGEGVAALIKRYVHSLKGDAGSLGLTGIQNACHFVEDVLAKTEASSLIPQLMLFKGWLTSCLEALENSQSPAQSPELFMSNFKQACELLLPAEATAETRPSSTSQIAPPTVTAALVTGADSYSLSGEMEIFQEFVTEAEEHLNNVESILLETEGAFSKEAVDTIFRGIHSLKGGSAYFTFKEMTETSHLLENLLDEVRGGKRELNSKLTCLVLAYIDLQKSLLAGAKKAMTQDGVIKRSPASIEFLQALNDFVAGTDTAAKTTATVSPVKPIAEKAVSPLASLEGPKEKEAVVEHTPESQEASSANKVDKLQVKNFLKVDTVRLDHLIDSIGEMVIYSSMLIRRCRELLPHQEDVQTITHRVEKFTRDLQDVGMSMRLVPIKGLFQKMSRLVWDTSKRIKKEILFSMDGEDTELDRNLIDKLADPLMHMVRNAIDHGIEPPEERIKVGKSRAGTVHLSAIHSGGCVLIKIQDDGRGLNQEKLLAKAKEKGIITESQKLTEQETFQLIFAPGFSTAAVVTDISGRGVGMDVVRRNVESLRGRIHIESKVGSGTTFTIELPLTLAIIDGIEVLVGEQHLIIPSLAIVEFVKPTKEMLNNTLEQGETFSFRGKYLPVFRVSDLFDIEPRYTSPFDATFIVVENHEELIALMVDSIVGELSTVIKSLGPLLSEVKGVSGCAVMANGDAALILDVRALVLLARSDYRRRLSDADESRALI